VAEFATGEDSVWVAVETSTAKGSVAVWKGGLAFEQTLQIQGTHSELMLPALDHALRVTGTSPDEVEAFVIGAGPGSFTGVRIAASLGKGWAMARGTPLYAYSSLLAVAAGSGSCRSVCAMFDARRAQVYAACYDLSTHRLTEQLAPAAWDAEELLGTLSRRGLRPVFVGEGAIVHRSSIEAVCKDAIVLPEHLGVPRAASLLWLRAVAPELGRVNAPEGWEPSYVRDWKVSEERRGP
jgi:tRNA threonylcarbamoyladenosine biosynthesis protein TsaB